MQSFRIHALKLQARCVLTLETFSLCFWRAGVWVLGFFGLFLYQIPAAFGTGAEVLASLLFFAGLAYWLYRDFGNYRRITRRDVERRLERDSDLPHRPLSSLKDVPIDEPTPLWVRAKQAQGNL